MKKAPKVTLSNDALYDVIRSPVITEKSTRLSEYNQVVFKVRPDANKAEIKAAVEHIFGVKVEAVNTLNQAGKLKRFRGRVGRRDSIKKAMVTLAEGQSLDVTTGI
ncbi:MAG: 50S ribosomal protein L23 [Pseudomonadota bacterium]